MLLIKYLVSLLISGRCLKINLGGFVMSEIEKLYMLDDEDEDDDFGDDYNEDEE